MTNIKLLQGLAVFVDHPLSRIVASLFGLLATAFLILFAGLIALSPPSTYWMLFVGTGGVIGLIGWWLRVIVNLELLSALPLFRWSLCASLAIGILTLSYTLITWPDVTAWRQFLYPVLMTGVLLFAGSLASSQRPRATGSEATASLDQSNANG